MSTAEKLREYANWSGPVSSNANACMVAAADELDGLETELAMWRNAATIERDRLSLALGRMKVACCAMRQALSATSSTYIQNELRVALNLCDEADLQKVTPE